MGILSDFVRESTQRLENAQNVEEPGFPTFGTNPSSFSGFLSNFNFGHSRVGRHSVGSSRFQEFAGGGIHGGGGARHYNMGARGMFRSIRDIPGFGNFSGRNTAVGMVGGLAGSALLGPFGGLLGNYLAKSQFGEDVPVKHDAHVGEWHRNQPNPGFASTPSARGAGFVQGYINPASLVSAPGAHEGNIRMPQEGQQR